MLKITNFIKALLLNMIIIIFDMMKHEVPITHFRCLLKYSDCLELKTLLLVELASYSMKRSLQKKE